MLSLVEMSATGGILIAAAVILRAVAGQKLPRQTFLALWGVSLARLLLPLSLPAPTSVYRGLDALGITARRAGVAANAGAAAPALAGQAAGAAWRGPDALVLAWGGVALSLAALFLLAHLRGRLEWRASLPAQNPSITAWLAEHPLRRRVQVRISDRTGTPLTYGMVRPVILLPKGLEREEGDRLAFVLAHEMAHIRRWDALAKLILCAAVCVHWFNPLVWVMLLLAERDLEVACDQSVVRMYGAQARGPYARTLLDLESRRARLYPLASGLSKNALEERIGAIMKSQKATTAGLIAAVALVAVVTAVFATTAPGRAPSAAGTGGSTAVIHEGDALYLYGYADKREGELKPDPETGHYYTKAQYDAVAALKTEGYQDLSIAEFNRTLYAALNGGGDGTEGLFLAYEAVLCDLPEGDPLAPFLLNTAQASLNEYGARLDEVFSGKRTDPSFSGQASATQTADVYGDEIETGWSQCSYRFSYQVLDQDGLTVAARDAFLRAVLDGMQAWLDGYFAAGAGSGEEMHRSAQAELDRLGKEASTGCVQYTSGSIEDCYTYCEGQWESGIAQEEGVPAVRGAWS